MDVIILTGGKGTRLRSKIKDIPKTMADVNRKRFLEWTFEWLSKFNVKSIFMSEKNGDLIFEELEKKINNKEKLTKQELVSLAFTPIMGGKLTKAEKIIKSIRIVKSSDNEYKYDIESMLYAFADKFSQGKDLQIKRKPDSLKFAG